MSDSYWHRAGAYSVVVAVAAAGYTIAQNNINARAAEHPIIAYFGCLEKFNMYDWDNFSGDKPPASDTCKDLASRQSAPSGDD